MQTTSPRQPRVDRAHHHPTVRRTWTGAWWWQCSCGGSSGRSAAARLTWHEAVVSALLHSECISP